MRVGGGGQSLLRALGETEFQEEQEEGNKRLKQKLDGNFAEE